MENENWIVEFDEKFQGQSELSQAILSALEYRGFYDAGKFLDYDIAEKISPIIKSFITSLRAKDREDYKTRIVGKIVEIRENPSLLYITPEYKAGWRECATDIIEFINSNSPSIGK